jgi:hypothetical protein
MQMILTSNLQSEGHFRLSEPPVLISFIRGTLRMQTVLQAIEDGLVSLVQSPPELYTDCPDLKARHVWAKQYTSFRAPSQREALDLGVKAFLEKPHLWSFGYSELDKLIAADMIGLQRQPGIMHRYRRYVVINAQMDGVRYCGESDGVSHTYLSQILY